MGVGGSDPLVGAVLGGTYRIEERLGAGGMGTVYAATHLRTGRPVAVKVLSPEAAARRGAMERFRREAEAVGKLGHANIVAIHDFDQEGSRAWLVMDRLEGEELAARLARVGPLSLEDARSIFEQIAAGLGAAHARGLLHRDLKPANVFLARTPGAPERAVILDFGLAKSLEEDGAERLTADGVVVGTPQYLAPEQATGAPLDRRADLYALATILYEMLAGVTPFSAPTLPALLLKVATEPPPPLTRYRPDLPPAVAQVLDRALAKSPDERFGDAASFVAAVRAASGTELPPTEAHRVITGPVAPDEVADHWVAQVPAGHAVVTHTPRSHGPPIDPHAPTAASPIPRSARRRWPWIAVALALLGAITGGVATAIVAWPSAPAPEAPVAAPALSDPAPDPTPEPLLDPALIEVEALAAPIEPIEPVAADPAPPAPIARRPRRPREPSSASAAPAAPASIPPPEAGGPPAGVQDAVAHMARSDWRGCIRAARAAPRSPEILGARMSCALRAEDHDELRATCREMRTHYPSGPYTSTCLSLLSVRGLEP